MNLLSKSLYFGAAALIFCRCAYSQSFNNNWVFGDSIGINFSTGEPVFFNSAIQTAGEACASISDSVGNLLFYTNGEKVWDGTHHIMPNGDNLEIGYFLSGYGSTISQGVLISPLPGNDNLYYIIYLSRLFPSGCCLGLKYSIVDMTLHGGLGDIIEKNSILLSDTLSEKLQLVKHGNGRDWWLITLSKGTETEGDIIKFVKYLITPTGILGPYYQDYADEYHETNGTGQEVGYMKFSQQGDKVCITKHTDIDLYDFNRCTGEFYNFINIDTVVQEFDLIVLYGIEYSVDGRYFYADTYNSVTKHMLYQFCLTCPDPVQNTKTLIYKADTNTILLGLLLGPDDKIYMSSSRPSLPDTDSNLYVINFPTLEGLDCDLDTLSVSLGGLSLSPWSGLPNMPNYNLGPLAGSDCDTLVAINESPLPSGIKIYPNPASDHIFIEGGAAITSGVIDLHLYNLLGEEVFAKENISFNTSIPLPEICNGLYAVWLMKDDIMFLSQMVVIKH